MRPIDADALIKHSTGGNGRARNRVPDRRQIIRYKGEGTMIDDLISRQAAIDEHIERIRANGYTNAALVSELKRSIGYLMLLPSEGPKRKHGYWNGKPICGYATVRCSVCGEAFLENNGRWNYCPYCGALMDGGKATAGEPLPESYKEEADDVAQFKDQKTADWFCEVMEEFFGGIRRAE